MTKALTGGILAQEIIQYDADGNIVTPVPSGGSVIAASPSISVASAISGQITVTTAGTSVQGGNVPLTNGVYIKALTGNTGNMFIGYATGDNRDKFELDGNQLVIVNVTNLNQLWFDASVNGEKVCWLKA